MRLDIPTILVIGLCAIVGYLVFTVSYLPEHEVGLYVFEFPIDEEIILYTVLGGNHHYYLLHRNFVPTLETMTIRNDFDESLTIAVIERHADPVNDRPFELYFPPRSEEYQMMYLTILMREAIVMGAGGIVIYFIQRRHVVLLKQELIDHPVEVNIGPTIIDSPSRPDTYDEEWQKVEKELQEKKNET